MIFVGDVLGFVFEWPNPFENEIYDQSYHYNFYVENCNSMLFFIFVVWGLYSK